MPLGASTGTGGRAFRELSADAILAMVEEPLGGRDPFRAGCWPFGPRDLGGRGLGGWRGMVGDGQGPPGGEAGWVGKGSGGVLNPVPGRLAR